MKEIKLRNGFVAMVDDEDYDDLNKFKWYAHRSNSRTFIARRTVWIDGCSHELSMHRAIMKPPSYLQVDHINHNGLDNRRCNLRNCTQAENLRNKMASGRSKYLGVAYCGSGRYIRARIYTNGKSIELGRFPTEELAAAAYDEAAKKYHGEFANLNFK